MTEYINKQQLLDRLHSMKLHGIIGSYGLVLTDIIDAVEGMETAQQEPTWQQIVDGLREYRKKCRARTEFIVCDGCDFRNGNYCLTGLIVAYADNIRFHALNALRNDGDV